jgi:PAS domain S-box-containing protein
MIINTDSDNTFKYELFFELSPDLLCIAGYDGFFKKINNSVSKLLGYSLEELYARPINDFVYHEDQDITAMVRDQLTKRKPLYNFENRYVTKSGEIVWLAWTSLPIESDQLIFAIAKNISHKKRLETDRNLLLANLTKVNEELKQLTYTTAHDLRSPVNNLLSTFSLMDTSKIRDPETLEFVEILRSSGESLKKTLNNYVDLLSKKEGLHVDIEELDLNECLQPVLNSVKSLIESSKATVHINFNEVEKISFNKAYLESVFLNLITNAIKYAKPDCSPVISIYSTKVNDVSQLIVTDNGIGFDMEKVKEKIFGLHQKFHDNKDSKGIGLYLVHNHITKLGGQINIKSKVNEGSTFIISFKNGVQ